MFAPRAAMSKPEAAAPRRAAVAAKRPNEAGRAANAVVPAMPADGAGWAPLTPGQRAYFEPRPAPRFPIQAKHKVGAVNDPLEQEADRVADAVVSGTPAGAITGTPHATAQRERASCADEDRIQGKPAEAAAKAVSRGGAPLTPEQRAYFEPRFGKDFSEVRVHSHEDAARAALSIHARAFTLGSNIGFAAGEQNFASVQGRRLLAHELTHVLQQTGADHHQVSDAGSNIVQRQPIAGAEKKLQPFDLTETFNRMRSYPEHIDNNITKVSYFTAELARIHYKDGSTFELGLVPKWMKPPVVEVDCHTPAEDFRMFEDATAGRFGLIVKSEMAKAPRTMPYQDLLKTYVRYVDHYAVPGDVAGTAHIVPSRINMLTAPTLCGVLRDSEARFIQTTAFVSEFGLKVAPVILGMGGGSLTAGPNSAAAAVASAERRIASNLAAKPAVRKLTREIEDRLVAGGSKKITAEGVEFAEVQVTKQGDRLAISRYSTHRVNAPRGQGQVINEAFEDAAVAVARKNGLKTVTINVGKVTNPGWREYLESIGYKKTAINTEGGVTFDWVKTVTLSQ